MITFLRSLVFNVVFFGGTALFCFAYLPTLLLPRPIFMKFVRFYFRWVYWMEKYILGLDFKVEGLEHLPKGQPFLIAMKHQSAYETMKLHVIFEDPAIILKKELMMIPIWGWIARKAEMIAVDRSNARDAVNAINTGIKPVLDKGRAVVIFPQGTRVKVGDKKPYKNGIMRLYETFNTPIVPVALNSGDFWPKKSFTKKSGLVTFRFMPAIPAGLNKEEAMERLQNVLETESDKLSGL